MFETEEVEGGYLIEWDVPIPPRAISLNFNTPEYKWAKRVGAMRHHPGRRARIMRDIRTSVKAQGQKSNILRSLHNHDKYENWTVNVAKEEKGTWSIFITFEGRLTEQEYQAKMAKTAKRYADNLAAARRNKLIKQQRLGNSLLSANLKPPTIG